jgi:hypothetical protein
MSLAPTTLICVAPAAMSQAMLCRSSPYSTDLSLPFGPKGTNRQDIVTVPVGVCKSHPLPSFLIFRRKASVPSCWSISVMERRIDEKSVVSTFSDHGAWLASEADERTLGPQSGQPT